MRISSYDSKKIAVLNVIAIIAVLFIHSYYIEAESYEYAGNFQKITGTNGMAGLAVPLFYFISGLLFFKNVNYLDDCISGMKKRVRTLLIPYVLGNLFYVACFLLLFILPMSASYVNDNIVSNISLDNPLESLLYVFVKPAGFHLWFLRDLIAYAAISPLLFWSYRKMPWITLIALFVLFGGIRSCGITYFYLGGLIAMCYGLEKFQAFISHKVLLTTTGILFLGCLMTIIPWGKGIIVSPYLQQTVYLNGVIAVWGGYNYFVSEQDTKLIKCLLKLNPYTFFIYLLHEPVFNVIKKVTLKVVGVSEWSLIILYIVNPFILICLLVGVAIVLQKIVPSAYRILTGGR